MFWSLALVIVMFSWGRTSYHRDYAGQVLSKNATLVLFPGFVPLTKILGPTHISYHLLHAFLKSFRINGAVSDASDLLMAVMNYVYALYTHVKNGTAVFALLYGPYDNNRIFLAWSGFVAPYLPRLKGCAFRVLIVFHVTTSPRFASCLC
jgi:hypothetical protein